jgi:uncharacterized membrane protein
MLYDREQSFRKWARENDPSELPQKRNIGNAERWISAFGGGALAAIGISRRSPGGLGLALAGGYLLYRGVSGQDPIYRALGFSTVGEDLGGFGVSQHRGIRVEESVLIQKPADELYHIWRRLENLPRFMKHLKSVKALPNGTSHWTAKGPANMDISWDAEIVGDEPGKLISWRSLPHSSFQNAGAVRFDAEGEATRVHVSLTYNPPAGKVGAAVARMMGEDPARQIREDLDEFRAQLEGGSFKEIDEAIDESFPASDPPSYSRENHR